MLASEVLSNILAACDGVGIVPLSTSLPVITFTGIVMTSSRGVLVCLLLFVMTRRDLYSARCLLRQQSTGVQTAAAPSSVALPVAVSDDEDALLAEALRLSMQ